MGDFIYGSRAKIGLIYPGPGWIMEPEFYLMAPKGVATYTTRLHLHDVDVEGMTKFGEGILKATKLLAEAPLDVITLGCTSGSFVNGAEYDKKVISNMEQVSGGIPCTTTSSSVIVALNALKMKKVAIATPYIDEVNQRAKRFLEEYGIEVVNLKGLGLLYDYQIDRQDLETVYRLTKDVDINDADGIAILCTGIRSVPIIETLEIDLGKPVISAVQATFWKCLRLAGVKEKIAGYGRLLQI